MHSCNYEPFHFLWTLQHKCNSPLGPTSFFFPFSFFSTHVLKGNRPKNQNHRQGVQICSLSTKNKLSWKNAASTLRSSECGVRLAERHAPFSRRHPSKSSYILIMNPDIYILCMTDVLRVPCQQTAAGDYDAELFRLLSCSKKTTNLFVCHYFVKREKNTNWAQVIIKVESFICVCCNRSHSKFIVLPKHSVVSSCGWLPYLLSHASTLCKTWGEKKREHAVIVMFLASARFWQLSNT